MGCDACQDACPYNKRHSWNEGEDFPGLKEIEALLQPKNIISASDEELIQKVIPRAEHHLTSVQTDVLRINAILIRIFPAISLDSKTFLCTSQY